MKSKYLMIGAAVCAALFLFSGIMLCRQYADGKQAAEAFEQVAALLETEPLPELTPHFGTRMSRRYQEAFFDAAGNRLDW